MFEFPTPLATWWKFPEALYAVIEHAGLRMELHLVETGKKEEFCYTIMKGEGDQPILLCEGKSQEQVRDYIVQNNLGRVDGTPFLDTVLAIIDAAGKREAFETERKFHFKFFHPLSNPLVIEASPDPFSREKREITVYHLTNLYEYPHVVLTDKGTPRYLSTADSLYVMRDDGVKSPLVHQSFMTESQVYLLNWANILIREDWVSIAQNHR